MVRPHFALPLAASLVVMLLEQENNIQVKAIIQTADNDFFIG